MGKFLDWAVKNTTERNLDELHKVFYVLSFYRGNMAMIQGELTECDISKDEFWGNFHLNNRTPDHMYYYCKTENYDYTLTYPVSDIAIPAEDIINDYFAKRDSK
jgi:hypothetical protein